jgi:hypothetical protein
MKKTLLSLAALVALSSSAFATCTKADCTVPEGLDTAKDYTITSVDNTGKEYYLNVSKIRRDVHVGLGGAKVEGSNSGVVSAGMGLSSVIYDNVFIGADLDMETYRKHGSTIYGGSLEVKAGPQLSDGVAFYGIVGAKRIEAQHGLDTAGLGLGVGMESRLTDYQNVVVSLSYTNYNMIQEGPVDRYSEDSVGAKIRYVF